VPFSSEIQSPASDCSRPERTSHRGFVWSSCGSTKRDLDARTCALTVRLGRQRCGRKHVHLRTTAASIGCPHRPSPEVLWLKVLRPVCENLGTARPFVSMSSEANARAVAARPSVNTTAGRKRTIMSHDQVRHIVSALCVSSMLVTDERQHQTIPILFAWRAGRRTGAGCHTAVCLRLRSTARHFPG
jgi:hypothetical protein